MLYGIGFKRRPFCLKISVSVCESRVFSHYCTAVLSHLRANFKMGRTKFHPFSKRFLTLILLVVGAQVIGALPPWGMTYSAAADCLSDQFSMTKKHNNVFYFDNGTSITSGYAQYQITNKGAAQTYWAKIANFTGGALALANHETSVRPLGSLSTNQSTNQYWYLTASSVSGSSQNFDIEFYLSDPSVGSPTPICKLTGGFSSTASTIKLVRIKLLR